MEACKKSEKLIGKRSGKYYERTNIIAGYVNNKSIAPMVFNGSCNTKLFETWVEKFLIKELKPDQFVVMDNASFHRSQKTKELIESVGCQLIFLPPYSPDLNPIEKFWANLKRWIKQHLPHMTDLHNTTGYGLLATTPAGIENNAYKAGLRDGDKVVSWDCPKGRDPDQIFTIKIADKTFKYRPEHPDKKQIYQFKKNLNTQDKENIKSFFGVINL